QCVDLPVGGYSPSPLLMVASLRSSSRRGGRICPVGLLAHLLLVVERDTVVDVDDLRHGQCVERRRAFELGGEVFRERAQEARNDSLFLLSEEAAILIRDTPQPSP